MANKDRDPQGEEMVGKLIAAAGRGPTARPEARDRIYAVVRERWEAQTRDRHADDAARATSDGDDGITRVGVLHPRSHAAAVRGRSYTRRTRLIGLAASIAVVALAVSWLYPLGPSATSGTAFAEVARVEGTPELQRSGETLGLRAGGAEQRILTGDTLRTAANARVALRLEDGVLLRLNTATEVRFNRPDEVELMSGMVYIDSGSGASSQELRIETALGAVEHLGTQYEVNLGDRALRVRVREGRVSVRGASGETTAVAGEQLVVDESGQTARSEIAANDPAWNWATGLATLPRAAEYRLGETLEWVAREQGLSLDFANATSRQRISGQIVYGLEGLSPRETLEVIVRTAGIQAEVRENMLFVTD